MKKVKAVFKFPNEMVVVLGYDDKQIPELQGKYSIGLADKIRSQSDSNTIFKGF